MRIDARQWHITVAICEPERVTQVIGDDSLPRLGIQSDLSMDGLYGESTKSHPANNGLLTDSSC